MKEKVAKSTPLTHFARHATAEQKRALHNRVINNAIARQRHILEQAQKQR